jgi:hypothetical protein
MSRKVFTAGEVLAAADVNNFLMDQTVMSFAGTAARGSAIPSPVEGMVTYLEDSNDIQVNTGSAYQSILGLQHIKTQVVGSGVTTVTVTDAFSANFDNYRIVFQGIDASTVAAMDFRLGAAATQYYGSAYFDSFTGAATGTNRVNNGTTGMIIGYASLGNDTNGAFDVFNPFASQFTTFTGTYYNSEYSGFFGGGQSQTTSYTSFVLAPRAGTLTGGSISVYGYRKA